MVKKKKRKIKKVFKRQIRKVRNVSKTPSQVKKDFELYAQGVERLKELARELKSLDTRGFTREEQSVKVKLKNVSDIPVIERELKNLKLKISGRYKPKRRKTSAVRKDIKELSEKEVPSIKKDIRKLGEKIEGMARRRQRIEGLIKRRQKVDSGVGDLVDVDFNTFLNEIKSSLSNRVEQREKEINSILKSDLQRREMKFTLAYENIQLIMCEI